MISTDRPAAVGVNPQPAEAQLATCAAARYAPLAYSQLAYWQLHQLGVRRSFRSVASATRLRGRLDLQALITSVEELVNRHSALRTRIVLLEGIAQQEIAASAECDLSTEDLTAVPAGERESEVQKQITNLILEPIDVSVGPLFGVRILKLGDDEYVLIVALDHMISDIFSMNVLQEEIFAAYAQVTQGGAIRLLVSSLQFADYAISQRRAQQSWSREHGGYWNEHLLGCRRVRFPQAADLPLANASGWGNVPVHIDAELTAGLRGWCRQRRVSFSMSIFCAYAALVLRWCDVPEAVIRYQSHGRVTRKIERSIGFFASRLYLRVAIQEDESFVDLVRRVTDEYCRAYEHDDFSLLESRVPPPEFAQNTFFNWIPRGNNRGVIGCGAAQEAITTEPIPFLNPWFENLEWDNEPMIQLYEAQDEVAGGVHFQLQHLSVGTMERFVGNLLLFVSALLRQPEARVTELLPR